METGDRPLWCIKHSFLVLTLTAAFLTAGPTPMDVRIAVAAGDLAQLSSVGVPPRTGGTIVNNAAAIKLGKALFWDTQVGGDGSIACATCHFHNGADNRTLNTINPGANGKFDVVGDAGQVFTPRTFSPQFDDIVGSQGIVGSLFVSVNSNADAADTCTPNETAPSFHNRRWTGRNTPPLIGP